MDAVEKREEDRPGNEEHRRPITHDHSESDKGEQSARVGRMTNKSVRSGVDELMVGGDSDVDGEETAEMDDRIPAQEKPDDEKRDASFEAPRWKQRPRPERLRLDAQPDADTDGDPKDAERVRIFRDHLCLRSLGEREDHFRKEISQPENGRDW